MKKKISLKKLEVKSFKTLDIKGGKALALAGTHYESICECKTEDYPCDNKEIIQ